MVVPFHASVCSVFLIKLLHFVKKILECGPKERERAEKVQEEKKRRETMMRGDERARRREGPGVVYISCLLT